MRAPRFRSPQVSRSPFVDSVERHPGALKFRDRGDERKTYDPAPCPCRNALPAGDPLRLRRPRVRRAPQGARHARRHPVRPSQGRAGRQGRADRRGTSRRTSRASRGPPLLRPPLVRAAPRARRRREPRHVRGCRVRRARRLRPLRRRRALPARRRRTSWRRSTRPTRANFELDEILEPAGLDPPQLPHGPADRAGALPRVPDLELPAHDAAHRRLHDAERRARSWRCPTSPSASSCTARTTSRGGRPDPPLLPRPRQRRRARPPRRGGHPPDEPLHALRAVPRSATSRSTCSGA